jgi:hypothetical protein
MSLSALSACGSAGIPAEGVNAGAGRSASQNRWSDKTSGAAETGAQTHQACGAAQGVFGPMMDDIASRFNQAATSAWNSGLGLDYTGHPDAPGGVSIQACANGKIAASASKSQVFISDGLLSLLAGAADAKVSTGDTGNEFTARLDNLIQTITEGASTAPALELSADALTLASSAVAFVVYHELAHTQMDKLTQNADGGDLAGSETKADIFAAQAMTEAGYDMNGVDLVFAALERVVPSGSMNHPSTAERAGIALKVGRGETYDGIIE